MKRFLLLLALLFPIAAHTQTAAYSGFCDQGATSATTSGLNSTNKLQGIIPYCTVTVYLDGVGQVSSASYTSGGTITGNIGQTCNATFLGGGPSGSGVIALTGINTIAGGTAFSITPPGVGIYPTAPTTATLTSGTATCSGTATVVTSLIPIKATIYKDAANTPLTNPYQTTVNGQITFFAATGVGYDIVKSGGIYPLVYTTPLTVTDWIAGGGGMIYPGANTIGVGNSGNNAWRTPTYGDILALWSGIKDAEYCLAGDGTMQLCGNLISLTTTGNPGPATLSPTGALNIPTGVNWFGSGNANVGGSLPTASTGNYNTASGQSALIADTTGSYNTALGYQSLNANTTGVTNTGIGYEALQNMVTGQEDTAAGAFTLTFDTGVGFNTAVGEGALYRNTTGGYNVAIGDSALTNPTTASGNTAVGYNSLNGVYGGSSVGGENTAVGNGALVANTTGTYNVAIGAIAGNGTPALQTGTYNTYLGSAATANADGYTNSTAVGHGATITANNQVTLGNSAVTSITAPGIAPSSGGPDCLQISNASTGGQVTTGGTGCAVYYNVVNYGAVADKQPLSGYLVASLTASSTTLTCSTCAFTTAAVGKYVTFQPYFDAFTPFATTPAVAEITAYISATQVTLSKTAANTGNFSIEWGTDNVPAFNACAADAIAKTLGGTCIIPAGNYLLATYPYYMLNDVSDDGSYSANPGGSGGTVTCTPSSGSLTSGGCVVSGGTLYKHSATLQTSYASGGGCPGVGWGYGPCGSDVVVTVTTNSSGIPTTATVVYGGFNINSPVTFNVVPLGGDGATLTATETGGTMNTPTLTAGGDGYTASSTVPWYAIGGGCTAYEGVAGGPNPVAYGTVPTNSNGFASGAVTVTQNATGCTSNPTIVTGPAACNTGTLGSPVWGQCSNIAPLNLVALPVQVLLTADVNFNGASGAGGPGGGVNLYSVWDGVTVDNNQPIMFGGTMQYEDIGQFSLNNGFMGIAAVNNANYTKIHDINFNTAIGMWTAATDIGFVADNFVFNGYASWINGGVWSHRLDFPEANGGFFDAFAVSNILVRVAAYGGPGSISQQLDDWFNNNFWHAEFSGASTDFPETCKFPQTVNQRQTSATFNIPQRANDMCYRGISSLGMAILTRDARSTGAAEFNNLQVKGGSRYIFYGSIGAMRMTNLGGEGLTPITGTSDPYRSATTQEGWLVYTGDGSSAPSEGPQINGIAATANSNVTQTLWDISGLLVVGTAGLPFGTKWYNLSNSNTNTSQTSQNPDFNDLISFYGGAEMGGPTPVNSTSPPLYFDAYYTNALHRVGAVVGEMGGMEFMDPTLTTDWLDVLGTGVTFHVPVSGITSVNGLPMGVYNTYTYNIGGAIPGTSTGQYNTASGYGSLVALTSGTNNVAYGAETLTTNTTTGSYNAAFGTGALQFTNGNYNTGIGQTALEYNTSGTNNTAVGALASDSRSYLSGCSFFGYNSQASADSLSDCMALGANSTVGASHQVVIGASTITSTILQGAVQINGTINVATARKGTFVCTSGGSIVVSNANYLATSDVVITNNSPGGTVSWAPNIKASTPGTSFTVICATSDTSTYNYDILN